jgi:hypothetical protein
MKPARISKAENPGKTSKNYCNKEAFTPKRRYWLLRTITDPATWSSG